MYNVSKIAGVKSQEETQKIKKKHNKNIPPQQQIGECKLKQYRNFWRPSYENVKVW